MKIITNTSGFNMREISGFPAYGTFRNNWRGRTVTVRKHPTDPTKVISVGVGATETVVCVEPLSAYAGRIASSDWRPYN